MLGSTFSIFFNSASIGGTGSGSARPASTINTGVTGAANGLGSGCFCGAADATTSSTVSVSGTTATGKLMVGGLIGGVVARISSSGASGRVTAAGTSTSAVGAVSKSASAKVGSVVGISIKIKSEGTRGAPTMVAGS